MKVILSIVACTLVVLLHQMQASMAQVCSAPSCPGTYDSQACQCTESRYSTCPYVFRAITTPQGMCACERKTTPNCPTGFSLDGVSCTCEPTYTVNPMCPPGAVLLVHGCTCVEHMERKCTSGTLSSNRCKCETTSNPSCSNGCTLNNNGGCVCESSEIVQCYSSSSCGGPSTSHSNWQDCCTSSSQVLYYRIGTGPCTPCLFPMYDDNVPF